MLARAGPKTLPASCDRLHPSQADLTTGDAGRAGSASRSCPSRDDPAGPNRSGRRPLAADGPNGHPPPHAEPAQFDPDPGPRLRRWGLRALAIELSVDGRQARSQRTVAFWMGSFSAACRPRMKPSIRAHDVNWLASDIGGLTWNRRCRD